MTETVHIGRVEFDAMCKMVDLEPLELQNLVCVPQTKGDRARYSIRLAVGKDECPKLRMLLVAAGEVLGFERASRVAQAMKIASGEKLEVRIANAMVMSVPCQRAAA